MSYAHDTGSFLRLMSKAHVKIELILEHQDMFSYYFHIYNKYTLAGIEINSIIDETDRGKSN